MNDLQQELTTTAAGPEAADGSDAETDAVAVSVAKLSSPDPGTRLDAVSELGSIESDEALRAIATCLATDVNESVGLKCIDELGHRGMASFDAISTALARDKRVKVRQAAASALGRLADSRAVGPLATALREDKSDDVRRDAAFALRKLGGTESATALVAGAKDISASWLKAIVITLLGELGDQVALDTIREAAASTDGSLARAGVKALFSLSPSAALEDAPKLLRSSEDPKGPRQSRRWVARRHRPGRGGDCGTRARCRQGAFCPAKLLLPILRGGPIVLRSSTPCSARSAHCD